MGSAVSTEEGKKEVSQRSHSQRSQASSVSRVSLTPELAISLVMPIYYSKAPLTTEEKAQAVASWKLIIGNRSEHFLALQKEKKAKGEDFPYEICPDYFSALFFEHLFQVHPHCKGLFANSKMKMRMNFMSNITMLLSALDEDHVKFKKSLEHLAKVHNTIGVKAVEYGIGCECLMYCIQHSIGSKEWTPIVARGWTKIFSRILEVIIPIVIAFEIGNAEKSQKILSKRQQSQFGEGFDVEENMMMVEGEADDMSRATSTTSAMSAFALSVPNQLNL